MVYNHSKLQLLKSLHFLTKSRSLQDVHEKESSKVNQLDYSLFLFCKERLIGTVINLFIKEFFGTHLSSQRLQANLDRSSILSNSTEAL